MKTININLIDDQTKESNKTKIEVLSTDNEIDPKVKTASIIIVICVCVVFVISCGIWTISSFMLKKYSKDLANLKKDQEKISIELSKSTTTYKDLENEKKTLKVKLLAKDIIDNSLLPWHKILMDISRAVPKTLKITEISDESSTNEQSKIISIKGEIPSGSSKNDALKLISFFVLNMNDNALPDSTLEKATIRKFDFDSSKNIYNFEIASTLKLIYQKNDKQEK